MTASVSDTPSEHQIGRYRLLSKLGEGGNAYVYRAELMGAFGFTKTVALKVIKPKKSKKNEPHHIDAFIREARLGGLIRHPHIVDVYELGEHDGQNYIAMELIEGWTLSKIVKQHGPLPLSIVLQIGRDICKGLDAAHNLTVKGAASSVVHRDLKPANVMMDPFGTVRVLDFGIALLKSEPALDSSVYGTLAYMAPEQILNKETDGRTDLFSLGAILYELTTGLRLFRGQAPTMVKERLQVNKTLQSPEIWKPVEAVSDALSAIIKRCLRKQMSERFQSANELRQILHALHQEQPKPIDLSDWVRALRNTTQVPNEDPIQVAAASDSELTLNSSSQFSPNNLPQPASKFFGRSALLESLSKRLQSPGHITLLGMGGMGKTRAAVEVGHRMLSKLPGGVWFCDLVEAKSLEGLLAIVVSALSLEVKLHETSVLAEQVGQSIAARGRVLIILDNAEDLKFELVDLLDEWENLAPNATFLVTSRVPLNRPQEDTWRVSSLGLEDARALFIDRSVLSIDEQEPGLDALLEQLDGMALAIELAARRTSLFRPQELLERLNQRFRLLRESKRSSRTERHAALTVVLDSTWEALSPWEQDVLAQCAVFRGGFRLEDAEHILDLSAYPQAPWVVDALQNLVDKSLIATKNDQSGQRLTLLVSVWAYASKKLSEFPPETVRQLAQRHAKRYAKYGTPSYLDALIQRGGEPLRTRLHEEIENLVVATQRSIAAKWVEDAVNNGMATLLVWDSQTSDQTARELTQNLLKLNLNDRSRLRVLLEHARLTKTVGTSHEAKSKYRNAVDLSGRISNPRLRITALNGLATVYSQTEQHHKAKPLLTKALHLCQQHEYPYLAGPILSNIGHWHQHSGEVDEALDYYTQALQCVREVGHRISLARTLSNLGGFVQEQGHYELAFKHLSEALKIHDELRNKRGKGIVINQLVVLFTEQGRYEQAKEFCHHALHILQSLGERNRQAKVLTNLGNLLLQQGESTEAVNYFKESLVLAQSTQDQRLQGVSFANLAIVNSEEGHYELAMEQFNDALNYLEEIGDGRLEGVVLARLAVLHARREDLIQARKSFSTAEQKLAERNERFQLALLYALRAEVECEHGFSGPATTFLAKAESLSNDMGLNSDSEVCRLIHKVQQELSANPF